MVCVLCLTRLISLYAESCGSFISGHNNYTLFLKEPVNLVEARLPYFFGDLSLKLFLIYSYFCERIEINHFTSLMFIVSYEFHSSFYLKCFSYQPQFELVLNFWLV